MRLDPFSRKKGSNASFINKHLTHNRKIERNTELNDGRNDFVEEMKEKAAKKAQSRAKRKVKSKAKRISAASYVIWVIALLLGLALGAFACRFLCRNDCFELKGKSEYTIEVGGEGSSVIYTDKGARVISFGKDISRRVKVSTSLSEVDDGEYKIDTSKEGVYYIIYTIDDVRFGDIKRVRTIRVGGQG